MKQVAPHEHVVLWPFVEITPLGLIITSIIGIIGDMKVYQSFKGN
jgi:hypothetical protein